MRLSHFIRAERAVVPLAAVTVSEAADALVARLVASGAVGDAEKLRLRLEEERPEDIVAMGDRAFLLHVRSNAVPDLQVVIGTAARPICRELGESDEVQCARIVLLIVAPPRMATRYLQVVGALARLLSKAAVVEAVLEQPSAESLAALPVFAEYELPAEITVRELMTERPRTVTPDAELVDAARTMVRLGIRGLPVVDADERIVGMLGERELMRIFQSGYLQDGRGGPAQPSGPSGLKGLTVRDAMTRQVLCVSPDQPLAEVAAVMANKDVERVPVVRQGRIVGLLTRGDIVRKLIGR
jgi:CBS domain-containing protein